MNPTAIYSKSGKGVQEASGKTSQLSRGDRAVLSAFDGKVTAKEVAERVGKPFDAKFEQLVRQLDHDGYIRQVSAGTSTPGGRPSAPAGGASVADLDFTSSIQSVPRPAPPPSPGGGDLAAKARAEAERRVKEEQATSYKSREADAKVQAAAFAKAREEAEIKAQKERERIKAETEAKLRAETEAKMRSENEVKAKEAAAKAKADAEAKLRTEAEAKVKAARDAAVKLAAEAKAKAEAELQAKLDAERAKAREEAERARKEAEEKARKEAEELRRRLEEERKAREEAERKAKEEAERARKEAEEKARREAEELRLRLEEERKAREEAELARKKAEEQAREEERRRKEEEERRRKEDELRARAESERREKERKETERREKEESERKAREARAREAAEREKAESEARAKAEEKSKAQDQAAAAKAPAAGGGDSFSDSLLADLDSFTQRDEDERAGKEQAERKAQEEARRRAEEEAARQEKEAKEAAARQKREDDERRRRDEEERRAHEEEERKTKEAIDRRRREDEERDRKAREAAQKAPQDDDDIGVSEDDLGMDDVKRDQAALTKESRRAAREREIREKEARREAKRAARHSKDKDKEKGKGKEKEEAISEPVYRAYRRPRKWGKPVAITLLLALAAAIGVLHVMPISTAEYEQAASEALGRPVRIGSANLSLIRGLELKLKNVSVGEVKIANATASPAIGSLFNPQKKFSRIELQGATLPQQALGALFSAKLKSANFSVARIEAKQLKLPGPVVLPTMDAEVRLAADGSIASATLRGPDSLVGKLTPNGARMQFDVVANSLTLPIFPDISLNSFAMKGSATPEGMKIDSWGGSTLDGGVSGTASVRWGENWIIDGVVTVRGINAAVFAPALLSEGKAEGTGKFSLHDPDPLKFLSRGRLEGTFSVHKGVLGSFDLSRAITTGGRQAGGRTPFTDMNGQGVFDRGAVALRNVSFGAGALNAGASADITAAGALSGRIVADVRTSSQTLRAVVNIGGTVRDPQVKN